MTDKELDYSKIILELQKINNLDKEKKLIQLDKLIEEIKNTDIIIDDSIYEYIQETKEVIEYKLNYKNELNILESKRETYDNIMRHIHIIKENISNNSTINKQKDKLLYKLSEVEKTIHEEHLKITGTIRLQEQNAAIRYPYPDLNLMQTQMYNQLIGYRIENTLTPQLAEQMGYNRKPNIYVHKKKDIELDYVGEKLITTNPDRQGRLNTKEMFFVECKTTINRRDIIKFKKKIDIVLDKETQASRIFEYRLKHICWIIACYGWSERTINYAKENDIIPITPEIFEEYLKRHKLLDNRIPICPPK
jgi:hypothetical protein